MLLGRHESWQSSCSMKTHVTWRVQSQSVVPDECFLTLHVIFYNLRLFLVPWLLQLLSHLQGHSSLYYDFQNFPIIPRSSAELAQSLFVLEEIISMRLFLSTVDTADTKAAAVIVKFTKGPTSAVYALKNLRWNLIWTVIKRSMTVRARDSTVLGLIVLLRVLSGKTTCSGT